MLKGAKGEKRFLIMDTCGNCFLCTVDEIDHGKKWIISHDTSFVRCKTKGNLIKYISDYLSGKLASCGGDCEICNRFSGMHGCNK